MTAAALGTTAAVALFSFGVNYPLGLARERHRRLSVPWLLWVHAGVPAIVLVRTLTHQPRAWIPVFIAIGVLGQQLGARRFRARRAAPEPERGHGP